MMTRGRPNDATIHLRIPQQLPEMVEGTDYATQVACHTGNYHIHYTNHVNDVTCEACLSAGRIKSWNTHVDDVIHGSGTFMIKTPNGIVAIEEERRKDKPKEERYVAWLQHDSSSMSFGATPHEAYSDLMGNQ